MPAPTSISDAELLGYVDRYLRYGTVQDTARNLGYSTEKFRAQMVKACRSRSSPNLFDFTMRVVKSAGGTRWLLGWHNSSELQGFVRQRNRLTVSQGKLYALLVQPTLALGDMRVPLGGEVTLNTVRRRASVMYQTLGVACRDQLILWHELAQGIELPPNHTHGLDEVQQGIVRRLILGEAKEDMCQAYAFSQSSLDRKLKAARELLGATDSFGLCMATIEHLTVSERTAYIGEPVVQEFIRRRRKIMARQRHLYDLLTVRPQMSMEEVAATRRRSVTVTYDTSSTLYRRLGVNNRNHLLLLHVLTTRQPCDLS